MKYISKFILLLLSLNLSSLYIYGIDSNKELDNNLTLSKLYTQKRLVLVGENHTERGWADFVNKNQTYLKDNKVLLLSEGLTNAEWLSTKEGFEKQDIDVLIKRQVKDTFGDENFFAKYKVELIGLENPTFGEQLFSDVGYLLTQLTEKDDPKNYLAHIENYLSLSTRLIIFYASLYVEHEAQNDVSVEELLSETFNLKQLKNPYSEYFDKVTKSIGTWESSKKYLREINRILRVALKHNLYHEAKNISKRYAVNEVWAKIIKKSLEAYPNDKVLVLVGKGHLERYQDQQSLQEYLVKEGLEAEEIASLSTVGRRTVELQTLDQGNLVAKNAQDIRPLASLEYSNNKQIAVNQQALTHLQNVDWSNYPSSIEDFARNVEKEILQAQEEINYLNNIIETLKPSSDQFRSQNIDNNNRFIVNAESHHSLETLNHDLLGQREKRWAEVRKQKIN